MPATLAVNGNLATYTVEGETLDAGLLEALRTTSHTQGAVWLAVTLPLARVEENRALLEEEDFTQVDAVTFRTVVITNGVGGRLRNVQ